MRQAIGIFGSLSVLGTALVALAWWLTIGLAPEKKRQRIQRWLMGWTAKGVLLPTLLWAVLNVGITIYLQPFMPGLQALRNKGSPWVPEYLGLLGGGFFLVATYWSAVTLVWVLASAITTAEAHALQDFKQVCLTAALGLGIPAGLMVLCGGFKTAGLAGILLLAPVAGYSRTLLQPKKLPPMYARAIARIKRGKYTEAESEILNQLENWEEDFDGWMMLAELYANHFNSLAEAEQTVLDLCAQPHTTPAQVSIALQRLADWQLRLAKDSDGARRSLLMICDRLRGTHLARMAQLRIDQLPASPDELQERSHASSIALPALGDHLDEAVPAEEIDTAEATAQANALSDKLRQNPNNIGAREKLARVLAERLGKPELGIEQIELLLDVAGRSDTERAEWLSLVAAWHLKYRRDIPAGRKVLERLATEYPQSMQAMAARRRLTLMARSAADERT